MIRNIDHANVIHYGVDSLIIRSHSKDNGYETCFKVINDEFPAPEVINQLDNEFEICSKISSGSIRKALRKEKHDEHGLLLSFTNGGY